MISSSKLIRPCSALGPSYPICIYILPVHIWWLNYRLGTNMVCLIFSFYLLLLWLFHFVIISQTHYVFSCCLDMCIIECKWVSKIIDVVEVSNETEKLAKYRLYADVLDSLLPKIQGVQMYVWGEGRIVLLLYTRGGSTWYCISFDKYFQNLF